MSYNKMMTCPKCLLTYDVDYEEPCECEFTDTEDEVESEPECCGVCGDFMDLNGDCRCIVCQKHIDVYESLIHNDGYFDENDSDRIRFLKAKNYLIKHKYIKRDQPMPVAPVDL